MESNFSSAAEASENNYMTEGKGAKVTLFHLNFYLAHYMTFNYWLKERFYTINEGSYLTA